MIITSLGNAGIHLKEERQRWLITEKMNFSRLSRKRL